MELNQFVNDYIRENHPDISDREQNKIENAIRAGYYFSQGSEPTQNDGDDGVSKVEHENLTLLNTILQKANSIFDSKELEWEEKYDMIFCDKISTRVYDLFDWYDPDTTYEEDVTSFMRAFNEYVEDRNKKTNITNHE